MLDKNKRFFRMIDVWSISTLIFLWLKFNCYINDPASGILVVVFIGFLREYVTANNAKRQLNIPTMNRPGGWWVVIWWLFGTLILYFDFSNPGRYHLPVSELTAVLGFVTEEYIRSRMLRKVQPSEDVISSSGPTNIVIVYPPIIFNFFVKK
ncbi:MAG: hypothetical protein WC619_02935 [Patescibacteria group bacterium]